MAALEQRPLEPRHVAQHGHARLAFDRGLELRIVRGTHTVQDDARNLRRVAESHKSGHLCGCGERTPPCVHHQDHGRLGGAGQRIGRGLVARGDTIVEAHGPLDDCEVHPLATLCKQRPREVLAPEKEVEVARGHAEHLGVKRWVKVVRAALARLHADATPRQETQQTAGQRGLSTPAGRAGEHDARGCRLHRPHSPSHDVEAARSISITASGSKGAFAKSAAVPTVMRSSS